MFIELFIRYFHGFYNFGRVMRGLYVGFEWIWEDLERFGSYMDLFGNIIKKTGNGNILNWVFEDMFEDIFLRIRRMEWRMEWGEDFFGVGLKIFQKRFYI